MRLGSLHGEESQQIADNVKTFLNGRLDAQITERDDPAPTVTQKFLLETSLLKYAA